MNGGARGLRIANIIKYLSEFGWQLDVVTTSPTPSFAFYDAGLMAKLPPSANIFRTSPGIFRKFYRDRLRESDSALKEPDKARTLGIKKRIVAQFAKGLRRISTLAVPDAMVEWYPFALAQGVKLVRKNNVIACAQRMVPMGAPFGHHFLPADPGGTGNGCYAICRSDALALSERSSCSGEPPSVGGSFRSSPFCPRKSSR